MESKKLVLPPVAMESTELGASSEAALFGTLLVAPLGGEGVDDPSPTTESHSNEKTVCSAKLHLGLLIIRSAESAVTSPARSLVLAATAA